MLAGFRYTPRALASVVVAAALLTTTSAATLFAAQPKTSAASIPVVGTVLQGGTFSGVMNITGFAVQNGQVVALGTVSGVATTTANGTMSILQNVAVPVSVAQATCSILHLDLGPLTLNLLGLQIDLSQVVLDITANAGAGNLLGNLLCAVAGLLDNPGGLAQLLNNILGALLG